MHVLTLQLSEPSANILCSLSLHLLCHTQVLEKNVQISVIILCHEVAVGLLCTVLLFAHNRQFSLRHISPTTIQSPDLTWRYDSVCMNVSAIRPPFANLPYQTNKNKNTPGVCYSNNSWQVRHQNLKTTQDFAQVTEF